MKRSLNRIGALLVLACALPMAGVATAQPGRGHDRGLHLGQDRGEQRGERRADERQENRGDSIREHREVRETQRRQAYATDVLRNARQECGTFRSAHEERSGRIVVECLSSNKMRELTYLIDLTSGNRAPRVSLVENKHNGDMPYRDGQHLDSR